MPEPNMSDRAMREVLEWFAGYAGDHIDNEHYQRLIVDLAYLCAMHAEVTVNFKTADDVAEWLYAG